MMMWWTGVPGDRYSKVELIREIENIGHRALRRELQGILAKAA
jgi:hypothetical protein